MYHAVFNGAPYDDERDDKFIHVHSRIDSETISIVVSNSIDGFWREDNGAYHSRKESGRLGAGLLSVKVVCEKHRGLVMVDATDNVWKASMLVMTV